MATKTINLTGSEVAVTGLDGAHAHIRNDGTDTIYAAKIAGITPGADGVASIPAGQSDTIRGISGKVYLLGTGSVLIQSDDYVASPFKSSTASGGSAVDEVARAAASAHAGNADIHVTAAEKSSWNGKAELSDIPSSLPANGGNADTIDGLHTDSLHCSYYTTDNADNCINPGAYICVPDATENIPFNAWGILDVRSTEGKAYRTQRYLCLLNLSIRYIRAFVNGSYTQWESETDASTLETHPASDFVLKSDYDALAARVAALEGGTT